MEVKYILELEVAEEKVRTLAAARLSLDDLVETTLKTALAPLTTGGAFIIYRAEQGRRSLIDLYEKCPNCGHPWALHFEYIGPDGKKLLDPIPGKCGQCDCTPAIVLERK